jgi:hypothetical protein
MKPSVVILLMLVVALIVAYVSGNGGLFLLLIPVLLIAILVRILRFGFDAPYETPSDLPRTAGPTGRPGSTGDKSTAPNDPR